MRKSSSLDIEYKRVRKAFSLAAAGYWVLGSLGLLLVEQEPLQAQVIFSLGFALCVAGHVFLAKVVASAILRVSENSESTKEHPGGRTAFWAVLKISWWAVVVYVLIRFRSSSRSALLLSSLGMGLVPVATGLIWWLQKPKSAPRDVEFEE